MSKKETKKIVYASGPLFSPEEKWGMAKIAKTLEQAGYATFLPHRDGLETYVMGLANDPRVTNKRFRKINQFVHKAIFAVDMYQIVERCDYLVFNMNGRVPDEGGVAETAVAFAIGKPLVIYKEDNRTKFNGYDNSMITGLSYTFSKVDSIPAIPREIERVAALVAAQGESPYQGDNIPPFMRKVVDFGRRMWTFMGVTRLFEARPDEVPDRLEEIAGFCNKFPEVPAPLGA